jgi:hypothetical protein
MIDMMSPDKEERPLNRSFSTVQHLRIPRMPIMLDHHKIKVSQGT